MGKSATLASVPSGIFVMPMTLAPPRCAFSTSCTISTLRPLRDIAITVLSGGNRANSSNSEASTRFTGRAASLNIGKTFRAACQLLPIPVRYMLRAPRIASLAPVTLSAPASVRCSNVERSVSGCRRMSRRKCVGCVSMRILLGGRFVDPLPYMRLKHTERQRAIFQHCIVKHSDIEFRAELMFGFGTQLAYFHLSNLVRQRLARPHNVPVHFDSNVLIRLAGIVLEILNGLLAAPTHRVHAGVHNQPHRPPHFVTQLP